MDIDCSKCGAINRMGAIHCRECGEKLVFELDEALQEGAQTKWDKFKKKIPFLITVFVFFLIAIPAVSIFFPFMPNVPPGTKISPEATALKAALISGGASEDKKVFYVSDYECDVILLTMTGDKQVLFSIEGGSVVISYIAQYYKVINLRLAGKVDISSNGPKFVSAKVGYFPAIFGLKKLTDEKFEAWKKSKGYKNLLKAGKALISVKRSRSSDEEKKGKIEFTFK